MKISANDTAPENRIWADRMYWVAVAAVSLTALAVDAYNLFLRPVHGDYACYGLPAANWVAGGPFAVPQQGPQLELDRLWRFNSPLLGGGPLLFFWIGEIGQDWYLVGCVLELIASFAVFLLLNRLALGRGRWLAAAGVTAAFVTVRVYLAEVVNQRYTIICHAAVALLYFPFARPGPRAPAFQWVLAGLLPLIHPALMPASALWILAEAWLALRERRGPCSVAAGLGLLGGVALTALWYLEPHGLQTQFLPHLRSREFVPFSGWHQTATWKYALPSQFTLALVALAIALAWQIKLSEPLPRVHRVRITLLAALMLILDARGRMYYLSYFLLGLAPAALALLAGSRWQRRFVAAWCVLAAMQLVVEVKLAPQPLARPVTRAAAREFLIANTRPGDVIVVGPPFILAAASDAALPEGRRIAYVVPMPLFLKDFDADVFLRQVRSDATVYVGSPTYFDGIQLYYKRESPPVFEECEIEPATFQGLPVIVARP